MRGRVLTGLLALLIALAGLGVAAQQQRDGTDTQSSFLERQLQSLVPGLRVEGLEGTWRAAPRARRITLSDADGVWLSLERVRLSIAPTALLRGVLRLEFLEAERLLLERLPAGDPNVPAPPPGDPGASVLPSLPDLPVDVELDRLAVERAEVAEAILGQAAAFSLAGRAALGSGRLSARLDLRRLDREGSAAIDLALAPAEDRLSATVTAREAAGGLVPTLLGLPDQPLALDLRLDGPAAAGAALTLSAGLGPDITLAAEGTVRATPDGAVGARLSGEARAAPLLPHEAAPLATPARFALHADRPATGPLALHRLELEVPAGRAEATGTLDLAREAPDLTLDLTLAEAARFAPLVPPEIAWSGIAARARVTGTLASPRVAFEARPEALATGVPQLDAVLGPAPRLSGTASLPGPVLDVAVEGAEGRLALAGTLAEPLAVTARLSLPRLEVLGAGSEGALEAQARAEGRLADPTVTLTARSDRIAAAGRVLEGLTLDARIEAPTTAPRAQARLEARLEDLPVSLVLRGAPEGEWLRLEAAEARLGPARLTAAGLLDPQTLLFDGTARLEAADLAPLGRLAGLAGLSGRLALEAALTPRPGGLQGFDARLDAPALALAGTGGGSLRATVAGTPRALEWTAQGRAEPPLPLGAFSGRGGLAAEDGGGWRLDLAALEAEAAGEALRLAAPARILLGPDGGVVLAGGGVGITAARGGRVQATGRWGPERADLTATLTALPLALAERFAPAGLQPQGSVSGEVRVTGPVARPEVRATIQGSGLRAVGGGAPWAQGLPALGLRAEATLVGADGPASLRAELDSGPAGRLTATARLPQGFGAEATVAAAVEGGLNLAPLTAPFLAAGADRVAGRITLALRAEGPLSAPRLGGRATLAGVEYRNPVTGVRVGDVAGSIAGDGTRLVVERLQGRTAGGGTIAIQGSLDLGAPGLPADLTLTARNARPVVSDLVTETLNADLRLAGPLIGAGATLSGTVVVLGAEIRIPETLPASVPVLPNVRTRGRPPPGAIPPPAPAPAAAPPEGTGLPPIGLAVTISAPQGIFVRGRGLDVELGGEVRVGGTLAAPVPQGELTLRRGTLDVLARRLTFQRGTIAFAGGTLTPRLDLAAVAQAGGTTITVAVRGTPASPEVTFTSSPELPQDEVLARLLFGRSTSRLSPFEIAQLAQAVGQLTGLGGGASGTLDQVRSALGLDRLGVTTDPQGRAAVEAGRYVAPGVFLGLRQGAQGQTGVGVEVEITPRLRLEGQTATGPAGDRLGLSYEFEW